MDLSNDLISKFVKITNDEGNKKSKESVVYGTTVEYDGEMYVRIDGSDLITPVDTTADIKADERVTVMIKDHTATVTGNISDPSASSSKLGTLGSQISEFDIIIANKVSTELLEAEIAQIEILIAEKADIAELTAIKADIEQLNAENANIENLVATKADITDLNATNANITNLDAEIADIQTLVNGNLTSDNIQSLNLTSANTTIQNALIKNAMIDSVTADKIQTGVLDTNSVTIKSEDGSMILTGSVQQFKDENGTVRIQIGKDGGGNFTFILYDETGRGVLIDESGIQSSDAIADGLIVDAKVAEGANIAGSKLDISSVITEINEDNSTTIKSNKIYLDDQEQSLTVAFNALKTQVETIQDVTIDGDLSSIVEQVQSNTTQIEVNKEQISTLVAENAIITKEVSDLEGNILEVSSEMDTKFTSLEQDLSGFKITVDEAYASKKEVTDLENDLATNYSTTAATQSLIDLKADAITSNISDTYASKQSVTDLEGTLMRDYSTTEDMHSAINQKADGITQTVSETYATKESITNLSQNVIGVNLIPNSTGANSFGLWTNSAPDKFLAYYEGENQVGFKCLATRDKYINCPIIQLEKGQTYTLSYMQKNEPAQGATDWVGLYYTNTSGTYAYITLANSDAHTYPDFTKVFWTFVVPEDYSCDAHISFWAYNYDVSFIVKNIKLEKGTIPTAWTTAPGDDVYLTEAINDKLIVEYSTTTQMNSAIDQKANQITQSVSENYATKQSVTDLNNNLTTNYSTTSAMNSTIDQKTNQITQSVSETYTTKTEFNNLEIGGKNLALQSKDEITNNDYMLTWYKITELLEVGQKYTISMCVTPGNNVEYYRAYTNSGNLRLCQLNLNGTSKQVTSASFTFNGYLNDIPENYVYVYTFSNNGTTSNSTIHWIKIEKGNKATDWSPAPEETENSLSSLSNRVQTAESTLSKDGLTTIIGDHYTTTSDVDGIVTAKGYATTSQVQQTKNELTATFAESGGYNLLYNGGFRNGLTHWTNNGAGASSGLGCPSGVGIYIAGAIGQTKWIKQYVELDPNEESYTISCLMHISSSGVEGATNPFIRLYCEVHYNDGSISYPNETTSNRDAWTTVSTTFTKPSNKKFVGMDVHIYVRDTSKVIHATDIMLEKGKTVTKWTPNPNEVFAGVTTIDKNGITVNQSNTKSKTTMSADGFAITRTDNNKDIFRVGSNGKLTLNGDFLCYRDGANQSGPRLETSGAMMYGYNDTGGNHPVFAAGLWTDQDMGYFSVGYTRADVTDANGCLWMSPTSNNEGCRLAFSRLVDSNMKSTNLYFQRDGAIDFITNLRGLNDTDDNYTYRFDSGMSAKAFRCNNIRTHNIYPRNNGSHNIGSPTMRYKDVFFDSASTTNNEFRIGTVNTDGSWKTYGPLCVNSNTGYVFPSASGNLSLGLNSLRFHTLYCVSSPNVSSDKRMKTDIHYLGESYVSEIINGRSKVNMDVTTGDMYNFVKDDLRLASYRYKINIGKGDTSVDYGFIAQDVLYTKVGSEIVQLEDPNDLDSNLSINQGNYIATIAGALQEEIKIRDKQIAELEDKVIGRLQEEIKMKDAQISDLETRLAKLESIVEQLIEK